MKSIETSAAAIVCSCLMMAGNAPAQTPEAAPAANALNDTARFLAGLEPHSDPALIELARNETWQLHANFFDTAWADLDERQLGKVRDWAATNTPEAYSSRSTLFYMFSGPDFLYAGAFYPQATTYVLCGIEPIGPIPDLSKLSQSTLGGELHSLQSSLNSVLNFSFFRTKDMKDDFKNHALSGTLPILYIFLERSGMTIRDVNYVSVDENGTLGPQPDPTHPKSKAPGVRITFTANGSNLPRTLYYFSTDISNDGLKHSGFLQYCKSLNKGNSFVKSASYLMHENYFSSIRSFLLDNTDTLIQDDSGIPVSFFKPEEWNMKFYGSYPGPIELFKKCGQPKLTEYYKTTKPAPLNFGIGYRHHASESTLMVMSRKSPTQDAPQQQPTPSQTPLRAQPLRALPVPEGNPQP